MCIRTVIVFLAELNPYSVQVLYDLYLICMINYSEHWFCRPTASLILSHLAKLGGGEGAGSASTIETRQFR